MNEIERYLDGLQEELASTQLETFGTHAKAARAGAR